MSAEILRRAADRLDALAGNATSGPWTPDSHAELEKGCRCMSCYQPGWAWEVAEVDGPPCQDHGDDCHHVMRLGYDDAAYIAAMNPIVGKALVAMLQDAAGSWDFLVALQPDEVPDFPNELALANAILGTPPP